MNDYRAYVECDYNSIYHHGIKGQKWGIRRYQNEDGSLTPAGQKRYGKLVARYKKAGMSDEEITAALQKRRKIETAVKVGVGAIAVGTAAYLAYKHLGGKYIDRTIKAGTKMNTLTQHPEYLEQGHFFVSQGRHDNDRYLGLFGKGGMFGNTMKQRVVNEAAKDIKIASEKNQVEAFKKLLKNDNNFAEDIVKNMGQLSPQDRELRRGIQIKGDQILRKLRQGSIKVSDLSDKQIKELHSLFDLNMVDHESIAGSQKKYFDELRSRGYGGKVDLNDSNYGGFFTKSAAILFDNKNLMNTKIETIAKDEQAKAQGRTMIELLLEQNAVPLGAMAAGGVAVSGKIAAANQDEKTLREARRRQRNNQRK